ncbi:MAG: hypothetical protein WA154_12190 [Moraxellaceae bacterium]
MTTVSEYKLTHAPHQVAGGILIDPDSGDAQQHVDHLRGKYGERLVAVFHHGEQVFPPVLRTVSHAS